MAEELVTVLYEGPNPIIAIRYRKTNQQFNFLQGKAIEVPAEFAKTLTGDEFNSRGFTATEMDLARAYDHHLFRIIDRVAPLPLK